MLALQMLKKVIILPLTFFNMWKHFKVKNVTNYNIYKLLESILLTKVFYQE